MVEILTKQYQLYMQYMGSIFRRAIKYSCASNGLNFLHFKKKNIIMNRYQNLYESIYFDVNKKITKRNLIVIQCHVNLNFYGKLYILHKNVART